MKQKISKNKLAEEILGELLNNGFSIVSDYDTIEASWNTLTPYHGDKNYVVSHPYRKPRGFNTVKGAINYIQNQ